LPILPYRDDDDHGAPDFIAFAENITIVEYKEQDLHV
jgi:hypothetical protein